MKMIEIQLQMIRWRKKLGYGATEMRRPPSPACILSMGVDVTAICRRRPDRAESASRPMDHSSTDLI